MKQEFASILDFWFGDAATSPEDLKRRNRMWFRPGPEIDDGLRARFSHFLDDAPSVLAKGWENQARGRLALIVLFDQFPRNIYRGTARAFAFDDRALDLCVGGIDAGMDRALSYVERVFFYMPLQHAESLAMQERAVALYEGLAGNAPAGQQRFLNNSLQYARQHRDLIARFGRFPHRNRVLGRAPTAGESAYLEGGGATFGQPA